MISRSEERSIEGLKSDWNSSCCISMMGPWLRGEISLNAGYHEMRNNLLGSERRKQLFDDVLLVQLGPDVIEGEITEGLEANLPRY